MISLEDRIVLAQDIDRARRGGARLERICADAGVSARTIQRWKAHGGLRCGDRRPLATIPYGRTWSYAQLASTLGKPLAVRAVGAANGRNPIPIILPCHRVIGADGSLTGNWLCLRRLSTKLDLLFRTPGIL
mgnify:CR=1 FL=1